MNHTSYIQTTPGDALAAPGSGTIPAFGAFSEQWLYENEIAWRRSYRSFVTSILNRWLLPHFADQPLQWITREAVMAFRSQIARQPGRKSDQLSAARVNGIMTTLSSVMAEASKRYEGISNPLQGLRPLKTRRTHIQPFTLDEVDSFINGVAEPYQNYYTVRFLTGLRTAEIDGLTWKFVDFDKAEIQVRETFSNGKTEYTKNDHSQRDIAMSGPVIQALKDQQTRTQGKSEYVFCTRAGTPYFHQNVTRRVWYPTLDRLGLERRCPYQTRHTAATLWLAAGENPEWIAKQMGHVNTQMLFNVYSRYVPNVTQQDGAAFDQLIQSKLN